MANKSLGIIAAIAVIGLLFLVYLAATFESPEGTRTVEIEQPVPRPAQPVQREEPAPVIETPAPLPVERPPVDTAQTPAPEPVEEVVELPPLGNSDPFVLERVSGLESGDEITDFIATEDLVRRFVVFAENISDGSLPQLDYPVRRLPQAMAVRELDENLYEMQPVSYQRFTPIVNALAAMEPEQGMALYRMVKPLLQEAYAEIGYPNRNFDEVVVKAIDEILAAPTLEGPFQLVKPKEMYVFADAEIESMSPVEKQLLRMGPANAQKLKAALEQYKELFTAR